MGIYPFMFAKYDDFLPIVDQLIKVDCDLESGARFVIDCYIERLQGAV